MRALAVAAVVLAAAFAAAPPASAGVPNPVLVACFPNQRICPERCSFVLSAPVSGCQHRFGGIFSSDVLTLSVTLIPKLGGA